MVVKNKNTSPASNKENEAKNKGLILNTGDLKTDAVSEILDILQDSNLINNWDFDRTDTNTDTEHNHYYFDSVLNNNSLNSIINNHLENKDITEQLKSLIQMKGDIMALKLEGTLDTKTLDFTDMTSDTRADLLKKVDDFRYITSDSSGATKIKTFNENLGLSRTDKPNILLTDPSSAKSLQGTFDFTFHFKEDLTDEQKKLLANSLLTAFSDTFDRYPQDFKYDLNAPKMELKDNTMNINFNNIFESATGPEIFMFSKKQVKKDMEVLLKNLSDKTQMDIKFSDLKLNVSEDKLKELLTTKKKIISNEPVREHSEQTKELIQENKNMPVSWLNIMLGSPFKDLEIMLSVLEDTIKHLQEVKAFVGPEIINEKIKEAQTKISIISNRKLELEQKAKAVEKLQELTAKTVEQVSTIKTLDISVKVLEVTKARLETDVRTMLEYQGKLESKILDITKNLSDLTSSNKVLNSQFEEVKEKLSTVENHNEVLADTLAETEKDIMSLEIQYKDLDKLNSSQSIEITSLVHQVSAAKTYTTSLQDKVSTLTEQQNQKDLEITKLKKELEISKGGEVGVAEKAGFEVKPKKGSLADMRLKSKNATKKVKKEQERKAQEKKGKTDMEDDLGDR